MSNPEILVIDDEVQIRSLLKIALQSNGYQVRMAATGKEGILMASNHPPDLIILDLGLPDERGHIVLKKLREWYEKPIMILSVQNDETNIVKALDNGANDYLTKPFRTAELNARIRSALRLYMKSEDHEMLQYRNLSIDLVARTVKKNDVPIKLTSTEYALLTTLARQEGNVLTHHYLLKQIWGPEFMDETQYLRVYIGILRKKIEDDPNKPEYIITESGIGYRFAGVNK